MSRKLSDDQIARVRQELLEVQAKELAMQERMVKYREENPIEFFTKPNPPQKQLLEAWDDPTKKVFTFTGANRIGKTTIASIICNSTLYGKYPWSGKKLWFPHNQPRKVRYVGQGWETHVKAVVIPTLLKWWHKPRKYDTRKNNQGADFLWKDLATGSVLEILSNNMDSKEMEGWEGDLVVYDEPPKRENRIACARGLIDRQGRELFVATLLSEAWIHREVIKAKLADGKPDPSVCNIHGEIQDNVGFGLTQEGVDQFAKMLRADEKDARLMGIPSYMATLVWPRFNRDIHLKQRFKVPLDWICDVQIDFHPAKPWHILFLHTDKRNFKYATHEIVEKGNPKYITEQILRIIKTNLYRVGTIQIDPLAKGDSNADVDTVYEKIAATLAPHGYSLETASKDKENGIKAVEDWLWTDNEMPMLFFFSDLATTITQVEDYMYDPETLKPSKENDDMCECLYRHALVNTQWYHQMMETQSQPARML